MSATIAALTVQIIGDPDPDTSWLEQDEWADRLAEYRDGSFGFVGVRVAADLLIPHGPDGWITQRIESPGLWGIEDDSGEAYFAETAADELGTLLDMLAELNVAPIAPDDAPRMEYR